MEIPQAKVRFIASLSNGETIIEGKGDFEYIDGQQSPWLRLVRHAVDKQLEITSLALFTPDGRTFTLPSRGKNPKFKAFLDSEKPIDYQIERKLSREMVMGKPVNNKSPIQSQKIVGHYTVGVAIFPDKRVEVWVDEGDTRNSWFLTTNL